MDKKNIFLSLIIFSLLFTYPHIIQGQFNMRSNDSGQKQGTLGFYTPTPTFTPSPTITPFFTPTALPTNTPYIPFYPTATPQLFATDTPYPTATPLYIPPTATIPPLPTITPFISQQACATILRSYTYQGITIGFGQVPNTNNFAWYFLSATSNFDDFNAKVETIFSNFTQATNNDPKIITARADFVTMFREYSNMPHCPTRFTAMSPTLFIYGNPGDAYTISTNHTIHYADPQLKNNIWQVKIEDTGLSINGVARPYIYYEYEKINFQRPAQGWNLRKAEIHMFVNALSAKLELLHEEKNRLLFELNYALQTVETEDVFIGLIDPQEIEQKLPLVVQPQPHHISRYHFYIGKAHTTPQAPVVHPVPRGESLMVELGAAGFNY